MLPKLLTEFIGTFFLVLTIGLTVLIGSDFAPIAIGSVLMVMIYMGGHISGAHYNPAVTLAVWMRGLLPTGQVAPYMGIQVLGGAVGAIAADMIVGDVLRVAPAAETGLASFFLLELLFTFALALVILHVATNPETEGNSYYGLAIGFTVLAGAFAAGPISGGAFNPAVAVGALIGDFLVGDGQTAKHLWVYLVATFAGGALAAVVYKLQTPTTA